MNFFWELITVYHPIYTFCYHRRIQGTQLVQPESPFNVRYRALQLILFIFAQEENITYFKTTLTLATAAAGPLLSFPPSPERLLPAAQSWLFGDKRRTRIAALCCLAPSGGLRGPSTPPWMASATSSPANHSLWFQARLTVLNFWWKKPQQQRQNQISAGNQCCLHVCSRNEVCDQDHPAPITWKRYHMHIWEQQNRFH